MNFAKAIFISIAMALLLGLSSWISIPLGPVPITMQLTVVFLIGLLLPIKYAVFSLALYLILGASGVPIFAEGRSGFSVLTGPTGGYLLGFLMAAALISHLTKAVRNNYLNDMPDKNNLKILWACLAGSLIILGLGVGWGKVSTALPWGEIIKSWFLPFLPGLFVKMALAFIISIQILKTKITLR
ncbi:MAG TPA: biotin transporter BioY [Emcibacteraceae bacterium]|nr:biotin transporter BioY [Emcibacteraceae bacterium]